MKQHINSLIVLATTMLAITLLNACSKDEHSEIEDLSTTNGTHNYRLHLNCQIEDSTAGNTRAGASWDNGTTIYLRFKSGSTYTSGTAVYNRSTDEWTVSTSSSLSIATSSTTCEAYYFKNPGAVYSTSVNLNENTACYHATGDYSHPTSSDVYVNIKFKPQNWRLRFYGSSGTRITIQESGSDIYYYTSFNRNTGEFSSAKKNISLTVGTNSFTPYIYGVFQSAKSSNSLSILTGSDDFFYRTINGLTLQNKGSGYLTIPTTSNYTSLGWNKLTASMSNTRYTYSGGSKTLSITAPAGMSWTLSTSNSSYVTLSKTSGTGSANVTVTLGSNSGSYRYPSIYFKVGSQYSQTISLTQGYIQRIINYRSVSGGTVSVAKMYGVRIGDQLDFDWGMDGQKHQLRIYLNGASYVELVDRSYSWGGYDNYSGHKTYTFSTAGDYTLYLYYSTSYNGQYYNGGIINNVDWIHN